VISLCNKYIQNALFTRKTVIHFAPLVKHQVGDLRRLLSRYRFGPYALDQRARELRKFDIRVPLQSQPFEALTFLLERQGQIVTRKELCERLWDSDVHVDFERSLNRIMNKVRVALGDSAERTKFVETLPGQGYRFIHPQVICEGSLTNESTNGHSISLPFPVRGALPLQSRYYMERPVDRDVKDAVAAGDSVVLIKGPRQTGKTSLLVRVVEQARRSGVQTIFTDFQKFNLAHLGSVETFLPKLAENIAEQAGVEVDFTESWSSRRGPSMNFDRFMKRHLLASRRRIIWIIDEADRLCAFDYASEFYGLLRSWHNERALEFRSVYDRLTIIIAYATEAHLFISDLNQSPFNVGTLFVLGDLTLDEVRDLHRSYADPLGAKELADFYRLFGGHPYLSQIGFHEIVNRNWSYLDLANAASNEDGPFGGHLRRIVMSVQQNPAVKEALCRMLTGRGGVTFEAFYRLRSAGIIRGDSPREAEPRCALYRDYLSRTLL
jgi:DNA-binding winged helix-turn-helix (wHTH) protein